MNRLKLYRKLSWKNFTSYRRLYIPLILASSSLLMMFLMLNSIKDMFALGERQLATFIDFGSGVIAIFSLLFIGFARHFIFRQRGKEMGLYTTLGLGKREFSWVYFLEQVYTYLISSLLGLALTLAFGPLVSLIFQRLTETPLELSWKLSAGVVGFGLAGFGLIFGLAFLPELVKILRLQPKQIFDSGRQTGTRLKVNYLSAIMAALMIGLAYYWALTIEDVVKSSLLFLIAIILVIIGTYCFYHALLIAVLKFLQKRKKIYHKPHNFIMLSSMSFRIKAHASGLASITILACMVLVTVTTTLTVFSALPPKSGQDLFDTELVLNYHLTPDEEDALPELWPIYELAGQKGRESLPEIKAGLTDLVTSYDLDHQAGLDLHLLASVSGGRPDGLRFSLAGLEQAEALFDRDLSDNKVYAYIENGEQEPELEAWLRTIPGLEFEVIHMGERAWYNSNERIILFLPEADIKRFFESSIDRDRSIQVELDYLISGDFSQAQLNALADEAINPLQKLGIAEELEKMAEASSREFVYYYDYMFNSVPLQRQIFMSIFSVFMFIGIVCSLTFLIGMSVITWFKQYSEAEVERRRIAIMEEIGLDEGVIKKSVKSQIYWLLTLPLFLALVHCSFALPYLHKGFLLMSGSNEEVFVSHLYLSAAKAFVFLMLIYYLIYRVSAAAYWRTLQLRNSRNIKASNRGY